MLIYRNKIEKYLRRWAFYEKLKLFITQEQLNDGGNAIWITKRVQKYYLPTC